MRVVHLYPFVPRGRHGGTLRLAAAVEASATLGEPEVHYFDPEAGAWRGPVDRPTLARSTQPLADEPAPSPPGGELKRRLFPSTLWESGRAARRAIGRHADRLEIDPAAVVVLHTTYLAGLLPVLAPSAHASVVDVYDLVWRAHRNDAAADGRAAAALRIAYSRSVRAREEPLLRGADAVLVAGYEDRALLAERVPAARWVPTPTPVDAVEPAPPSDGRLRVGLLGNFAHISTRRSAERVLRSPLATDPSVRVLFAGRHAGEAIAARSGVEVIGPVERAEDFYARVDCVVAPVELGSGIKCKLGEALLAGRPVVTTALGASGFPPSLRAHFTLGDPRLLGPDAARRAVAAFDRAAARAAAERELGREAVIARYAAGLEELAARPAA